MKKYILSPLMIALSAGALAITPFNVDQVDIQGVTKAQEQGILQLINVNHGSLINDAKVSSIIKDLYSTGNFENVAVTTKNHDLVLNLQFKPRIASISFKGSNLIPLDQLRKIFAQNNVKQGAYLNKTVIDQLDNEIEKTYKAQGYNQVSVVSSYETRDDGTVNVVINVQQNDKTYLEKLVLEGNSSFTLDQLLEDSNVRPDTYWFDLYHTSNFNELNQKILLNNITSYYKNRGYAQFKVVSTAKSSDNPAKPQDITFTVKISEGNVYKYGKSDFFSRDPEFNKVYQTYDDLKTGELYKQDQIDKVVAKITNYLAGLGYAKPTIEPILTYPDANTVNVTFAVNKGERYTVGSIKFQGNFLTKDRVIRRQLVQQENSVFNLNNVNNDIISLQRTGYFKDVQYTTEPVKGKNNELNLVYKVTEASNGQFKIGAGYGDLRGLTFLSQFEQNNILGTGRTLGANLQLSKGRYNASLNYVEPFITTSGISLNNSINFSYVDSAKFSKNKDASNNYKQLQVGVTSGFSVPVTRFSTIDTSLSYSFSKFTNLSKNFYRGLYLKSIGQTFSPEEDWKVKTSDFTVNLSYNYNSYNRALFPTSGTSFSLGTSYTGLASTDKYITFNSGFRNYLPLNDKGTWVLSSRFSGAYETGLQNHMVPDNSLYSIGGYRTLRGFGYGAVGPIVIPGFKGSTLDNPNTWGIQKLDKNNQASVLGGNSIVSGGLDLIFPLFRGSVANSVRTAFFVDAASVWSTKWKKYTEVFKDVPAYKALPDFSSPKNGFRASAGVSLDWQSPLGILSFAVAYPVVKKPYDNTEYFSINFGSNF